jgi:endoglucanase
MPRPISLLPAWAAAIACALPVLATLSPSPASAGAARGHRHRGGAVRSCADPNRYPAARDPANPLVLPRAPGSDPLTGANLFVDGPRHGVAAGTIARLLGLNPARFSDATSWWQFAASLQRGRLHRRLMRNHRLARAVALLAKIADQPEENRFSLYSAGGGPGAVYRQVDGFFCHTMAADPGSIPVFTTYFLYQHGYCEPASTILAYRSRFERQVNEFAAAIGHRPAVVLLELDALGSARCMQHTGALRYWEGDIAYEIARIAALPHVVAYVEAGYADGNPPGWTAQALRAVGAGRIRGFFTNDTHNDWTIREIRWGERVSRLTHGLHFVVNTATNGRGPLLNPDPVHQGIEDLCNAPGRGLGPRPTTATGFGLVDAYLWTGVPGNSAGSCRGGPAPGIFWPARAVALAAAAQGKLGPGFASDPY